MLISSTNSIPAPTSPTPASGSPWEDARGDRFDPARSESVTIYQRPSFGAAPAALTRPWMTQLSTLPGLSELRLEGADLFVTPTQNFAGRALGNLLSPEVDGYRVVVEGACGPLEPREALVYLRDLPGVKGDRLPSLSGSEIEVTTQDYKPNEFYRSVFGTPRGLPMKIDFQSQDSGASSLWWKD